MIDFGWSVLRNNGKVMRRWPTSYVVMLPGTKLILAIDVPSCLSSKTIFHIRYRNTALCFQVLPVTS